MLTGSPLISDSALGRDWTIGVVLSVLVVVIVVVLLLAIIVFARRILAAAVRCLHAVEKIRANTLPLWDLATTNEVAADILATAASIKKRADAVAGALEATEHKEAVR